MMGKGCLPLSCRNSPLFENSEEAIQCRRDKRGQGSKETPDVQTRPPWENIWNLLRRQWFISVFFLVGHDITLGNFDSPEQLRGLEKGSH